METTRRLKTSSTTLMSNALSDEISWLIEGRVCAVIGVAVVGGSAAEEGKAFSSMASAWVNGRRRLEALPGSIWVRGRRCRQANRGVAWANRGAAWANSQRWWLVVNRRGY